MKSIQTILVAGLCLLILGCKQGNADSPERKPATVTHELSKHKAVVMKTSKGDITITLHWDAAPKTCLNFLKLAKKGFYDGLIFHRVMSNFMIQGGDPKGDGSGGPGYTFNDEIDADALGLDKIKVSSSRMYQRDMAMAAPRILNIKSRAEIQGRMSELRQLHQEMANWSVKKLYSRLGYIYTKGLKSRKAVRGAVAMANRGPDTNGSQFFINVVDTPWLDGKHTVFGSISEGMDVVDAIANVKIDERSRPVTPVRIISITLK